MNCLHFRTVSKRNSSPHHNSHCCRTHRWREKLLAGPHRAPLAPLQTCSFSAKPAHTWLGLQDRHHIWECQNTITDSSTEFPISWQRYIGSKCELSHSFSASTFLMFMVKTAPTWQEVAYQNSTLAAICLAGYLGHLSESMTMKNQAMTSNVLLRADGMRMPTDEVPV